MEIRIQREAFDFGTEAGAFAERQRGMGAVVAFAGIARDVAGGGLEALEIETYPGMAERAIGDIAQEARQRWSLGGVLVVHRHGALRPEETIMMVATAAAHRREAFEAAEFLMDFLKSRAPFWKREICGGSGSWVEASEADEAALARWAGGGRPPKG